MLKLTLQYFGHLMQRIDPFEKTLMVERLKAGGEGDGTTKNEMVGWHHQLDGHGFGWTPGVGDGQGGLACCSPYGRKESDNNERLNWTELLRMIIFSWSLVQSSKNVYLPSVWLFGGFYVIREKWISKTLKVSQKNKYMNMHIFKILFVYSYCIFFGFLWRW